MLNPLLHKYAFLRLYLLLHGYAFLRFYPFLHISTNIDKVIGNVDNIIGFASSIEPGRRVHMIENVQYGLVGQDHAMCWHLGQTCMYGNGGSYMATFLWRKELSEFVT